VKTNQLCAVSTHIKYFGE